MSQTFTLHHGTAPLLISIPHCGRGIPESIRARLSDAALATPDTDWHVDQLYAFAKDLGASLLVPKLSRYVIDLNRPLDSAPLYPGKKETGLAPLIGFDEQPLYREGQAPTHAEIAQRIAVCWRPYHEALTGELDRIRHKHGNVVLLDAHSIRSQCPMFFEGRLADLNLGTANGTSCDPMLHSGLSDLLREQQRYSVAVNGRFKGGYITRHYGRPQVGVHAVQLEIAQLNYMDESAPYAYHEDRAAALQALLRRLVVRALDWVEQMS